MGLILEEIRDEFLPESARSKRALSSQTEMPDATFETPSPNMTALAEGGTEKNSFHTDSKAEANGVGPTEEQLTIMNKHLREMTDSTLRSMLRCLKSTNSSPEVQKLVILRLGELSAEYKS